MPLTLILLGSLLGSVHCAAMCGGFVALCSQKHSSQHTSPLRSQIPYHVGRLCTYLILGAIAGTLGSAVNRVGESFGIAGIATLFTGILLIAAGTGGIFRYQPRFFKSRIFSAIRATQERVLPSRTKTVLYPFCIGFFSTFLPCGWLYSYVAIAAERATVHGSLLVMFVFWLGTIPILASIGGLSGLILSPLNRYMPVLASVILIGAGIFSIRNHWEMQHAHSGHAVHEGHPHDSVSETISERKAPSE